MDKDVIETLLTYCKHELSVSKTNVKLYSRKSEAENCTNVYGEYIERHKDKCTHYQKCIDQLTCFDSDIEFMEAKYEKLDEHVCELIAENNNLKDQLTKIKNFEFPFEMDIIERSVEFKNKTPYAKCDIASFRVGCLWTIKQIKSKLL